MMLDELLAEFGIGHLRRTPALALSGGERRRVEIARALATQPAYILLDEPLAGIDPIAVGEIRDLVAHLKDRGIGVLITDHNVRETLEIIDRAYIMHDGQVLMEGAPEEVVAHEDVRRVYLGERFQPVTRPPRHGDRPPPRSAPDPVAGDDAATASGHQAAAILQPRSRRLRRGGAGAQPAAGARRARRAGAASAPPPTSSRPNRAGRRRRRPRAPTPCRTGAHRWMPTRRDLRCRRRPTARPPRSAIAAARRISPTTSAASTTWPRRRPLREHLGEQLRLAFDDPVDRLIGAHLIALLSPAGRLTAEPAAIADAMGLPLDASRRCARA